MPKIPDDMSAAAVSKRAVNSAKAMEKAKAKVDWLIWTELRVSADAYRRIQARVVTHGVSLWSLVGAWCALGQSKLDWAAL